MYEPVAYDRRIERREDGKFNIIIRMDANSMRFVQPSLDHAQRVMEGFEPEVYEGLNVPISVFCHLG